MPKPWMLAGAGAALLACAAAVWSLRPVESGGDPPRLGRERLASGGREVDGAAASRRSRRSPALESGAHRITAWLGDPTVSSDEAARELWKIASERNEKQPVREEALTHALNLTSDAEFLKQVVPSLSEEGLWSGSLGFTLLDDLYDRPGDVQIAAATAMLPAAATELREELRELLEFLVDDERAPELDDEVLLELARSRLFKDSGSGGD